MEHTDFLKSLKHLKSHLHSPEKTFYPFFTEECYEEESVCTCTDALGAPKYLYSSQKEINYVLTSNRVRLSVYPCPYEKGWHLTKH